MKKKIIIFFISFILFIIIGIKTNYFYTELTYLPYTFSSNVPKEVRDFTQNPYNGFYNLYGYSLTDEDTSKAEIVARNITQKDNYSLCLLEINLKNFSNCAISENALTQLETIFSNCEAANKKLLLRFVYDWDGKAKETEPKNIEQIFAHMTQLSEYVNNHKNTIYIMQGIFVGNCGEMNNSNYMSKENMTALINHLNDCIDPSIYLSVRTPAHWRIINNITADQLTATLDKNKFARRLGLYNDGMLGSNIDLGTYGTASFENATLPEEKGTRQEEINFQNELCSFVPNGGECVLDNIYNDFENAISDLPQMHVSYLNSAYDANVLNKWKNSTYNGNDIFKGVNGYDYIEAHLGYRYVISNSSINLNASSQNTAAINFTIENKGFSPAYKQFKSNLKLINTITGEETVISLDFDNQTLNSNAAVSLTAAIDLKAISGGSYDIYYFMTDTTSNGNPCIIFANEGCNLEQPYVLLGNLVTE